MISLRTSDELAERLAAEAEAKGLSRNDLILAYIDHGLKTYGLKTLELSTSELQCLDQLAAIRGVTRLELMARFLRQRLKREFVARRQGVVVELPS